MYIKSITMLLLSILFCILGGFFLGVMDRTNEEVAFNKSIFYKRDPKWWVRSVSWKYVDFLPGTKYRPDAWHIAKTLMITSLACSATALMLGPVYLLQQPLLNFLAVAACWAVLLTASFVVFYDYILKRKVHKDGAVTGPSGSTGIVTKATSRRTSKGRRDLPGTDGQ